MCAIFQERKRDSMISMYYKGIEVGFVEHMDKWHVPDYDYYNQSLTMCKTYIDNALKKQFTRFKAIKEDRWHKNRFVVVEITSITDDKREVWTMHDGKREKLHVRNLYEYTTENMKVVKEIRKLRDASYKLEEKAQKLQEKMTMLKELGGV